MTPLIGFLTLGLVVYLTLSLPVRIALRSATSEMDIRWLFVFFRIALAEGKPQFRFSLFGKNIKSKKEKKAVEKSPENLTPKSSVRKKKHLKLTVSLVIDLIHNPTIGKIFRILIKFGFRSAKSIKIRTLIWDIGLEDYFLQGILQGVSAYIPQNKRIQINHNYQEQHQIFIEIRISIWRLLNAIGLLILSFPYIKTFRLYRSTLKLSV